MLFPEPFHLPLGLPPAVEALHFASGPVLLPHLFALHHQLADPVASLPAPPVLLHVDASHEHQRAVMCLASASPGLLDGKLDAPVRLDDDDVARLEGAELSEVLPRQATPDKPLDVGSRLVGLTELHPRQHSQGVPLDGRGGQMAPHRATHEEAAAMALDNLGHEVHALPPSMVRAPVGLDHSSTNPGDRHPLRVVLAVLVPLAPDGLDAGGSPVLRLGRPPRHLSQQPLPLDVFRRMVAMERRVDGAGCADHHRSPRRSLHGPIWPEVVGRGEERSSPLSRHVDYVHQRLWIVAQSLAKWGFLEYQPIVLLHKLEGAHVVGFGHDGP
mmetsp:Transcript_16810/g.36896  ORF Transcript_16810/g.36896 Transcript_16810/m.36896 type:complete len:328 (+) Transcript_16810:915-1898(+)